MEKVIYISRTKTLLYTLGCAFFTVLGIFMMFDGEIINGNDVFLKFVCVTTVFLFGFYSLYYLHLFIVKKPMYVINKKGILFKKKMGVKQEFFIPWNEITFISSHSEIESFLVSVKDARKYGRSATADKIGDAVQINLKLCDISIKDLMPILKKYCRVFTDEEVEKLLNKTDKK